MLELIDEEDHDPDLDADAEPEFINPSTDFDAPPLWMGSEAPGYDFGSLSEASTAWLGSLPDDYGPVDDVDVGFDPIAAFTN